MTRRKTWRTMTPDEREEYERQIDETLDLLEERMAYHRARAAEEREHRARLEARRQRSLLGRLRRRLAT